MPKNMKYDATTKKAGAPKKMKSNQDGGSMTAKDPAAAGKEMIANQEGAAKYKKGPAMYKKGAAKKKPDANKNGVPDYAEDGVGASRMGYSQKFGAGRMSGYDKGAAKVAEIMKNNGAAKYMEGAAQMKDVKSGERVNVKTSDGKVLSVVKDSPFHLQAENYGSVIQSLRPNFPEGDPYEANIPKAEKTRRKQATYPKK